MDNRTAKILACAAYQKIAQIAILFSENQARELTGPEAVRKFARLISESAEQVLTDIGENKNDTNH